MRKLLRPLAALGLIGAILVGPHVTGADGLTPPPPVQAQATLSDPAGAAQGTVRFIQENRGVRIEVSASGLAPGWHGFHVHMVGSCDPGDPNNPFTGAGAHVGQAEQHGTTGHDGDLPPLWANADGTARATFRSDNLTVAQLLDADGSAVIVHAGRDNLSNIPDRYTHPDPTTSAATPGPDQMTRNTGDSGPRQRCGVVQAAALRGTGAYSLVTRDGSVYAFGGPAAGSGGPDGAVVAAAAAAGSEGYWMTTATGAVRGHGISVPGSAAGLRLRRPVVDMAAAPGQLGATLLDATGTRRGSARFTAAGAGVRVEVTATGLSPGWHGMHVHTVGNCTVGDPANPFTAAGPHVGAGLQHGTSGHDGDLPALWVGADGVGRAAITTDNLTIDQLTDADGAAIIVHAGSDNLANIPTDRYDPDPDDVTLNTGDGGARQRCGVLSRTGLGYWLAASDGGVFNYGEAGFYGSAGSLALNKPIVGVDAAPSGKGYWLVGSDGGVFNYGDAGFYGSTGSLVLNKAVVAIAATSSGNGYWLVASDGGVFAFGDAAFHGSTGDLPLVAPIVSILPTETDGGYWLVAADGGVFAFGDAAFRGSRGGQRQAPTVDAIGG
jgi:Cu/Zn superoxide dismutase